MRTLRGVVPLALLGGGLMFVAHFAAICAALMGLRLPYWWAYPVLYPLAAFLAVRRGTLGPLASSAAMCVLPTSYFLALGVLESRWRASDTALLGIGISFVIAFGCSTWARRCHANRPPAFAPALDSQVPASLTALLVGAGAALLTFMVMMGFSPLPTFIFSALLYLLAGSWIGRSQHRRAWFAPLVMSSPISVIFVPMGMQLGPPEIRSWYFLALPIVALLCAYVGMYVGARILVGRERSKGTP